VSSSRFVPEHQPANERDVESLQDFVDFSHKLLVITGAGISTESGVPDYRSKGVGLYDRTDRRPVQYQDFVKSSVARQKYWARNYIGWPSFAARKPNVSHFSLASWQQAGRVPYLVTQNVDRLHQKAGSTNVTELHGTTYSVMCLSCDAMVDRHSLQTLFQEYNPSFQAESENIAPDADVEIDDEIVKQFKVNCFD